MEGVSSFGGVDGCSVVAAGISVAGDDGVGSLVVGGGDGSSFSCCSMSFGDEDVGDEVVVAGVEEGEEDVSASGGEDVAPVVGRAKSFCATGVALTERTAAPSIARTGCRIPEPTAANPSCTLRTVPSSTPSSDAAWVTCSSTCSITEGKARFTASWRGRLTGV